MSKKRFIVLSVSTLVVLLSIFTSKEVDGLEKHIIETQGTIGFTGETNHPIGTPDPIPPAKEITKPDGRLPQTNEVDNLWPTRLGIILICFVFFLWKHQRKQQQNYINKKAGTST